MRIAYNDTVDAKGQYNYNGAIAKMGGWTLDRDSSLVDFIVHRFGYDDLGRMAIDSITTDGEDERLQYDRNGNITSRRLGDLIDTFCFESTSNRMTGKGLSCSGPGSTVYTYDLNGQVKTRGNMTFAFNWRGLLSSYAATQNPQSTLYFEYDPLRQRVKTNFHYWDCDYSGCNQELTGGGGAEESGLDSLGLAENGEAGGSEADAGGGGGPCGECGVQVWHDNLVYFIFDQFGNVVAEFDGSTLARKYYYAGNTRFAMRNVADGSKLYYILGDQVASSRVLVQATNDANAGKLASDYDFYPYGQTMDATVSVDPKYQFGGHRLHSEAGIYYLGARFYDPTAMRFISMDPAGQFASPYVYGGGNPLIGVDPNGELFQFLVPYLYAAAAGALAGGTVNAVGGGNFWEGAAFGAMAGVTGTFATGLVGNAVFANALGNVGNYALTSRISGDAVSLRGLLTAGGVGAVGGLVPGEFRPGPSRWVNAAREIGINSLRGAIQGGTGAAIMGTSPSEGILRGAWGGAVSTTAQIGFFGPFKQANTVDERTAIDQDIFSGRHASYIPGLRSGGLRGWLADLGHAILPGIIPGDPGGAVIGRNIEAQNDTEEGTALHEYYHFVGQGAPSGSFGWTSRYVGSRTLRLEKSWYMIQERAADVYTRIRFPNYSGYGGR